MPRVSLPAAPASRRQHGVYAAYRTGSWSASRISSRSRFVTGTSAVGHQVQLVAGDDVHLVFLVRDLAGAAGARRVDHGRRPHLGEAVLGRVDVEEPADEAPLEPAAGAGVDGEPRARRPSRRGRCRSSPATRRAPSAGAASRPSPSAASLLAGAPLAPGADGDVRLLAADRDLRVGRVRDAQEQVLELLLGRRELRVDRRRSARRPRVLRARSAATSGPSGVAPPRIASPICLLAVFRSALRLSASAWSRRRSASTSIARSTSDGSSRLSMAPWRMRSGSSRRRWTPTLMRDPPPLLRPRSGGGPRSRARGWRAATRRAGRWAGRGT